ncbi:hypothetical protein GC722_00380 [Auraticoccus sp. F435]|uniref:HEAT repeat domain-containing protein n=1 Tax=Auraticoccus cholistanensis TaxID=2656650 RepID=A0A6A9UPN4_9ACTN|nr:hypothetical protein [Auraticoccus cholistanensis]MVA74498.1 hypothetical protein [Auraticoccus cholistanensis]
MSLTEPHLTWFIDGLTSPDEQTRFSVAEAVDDWLEYFDLEQASQIGCRLLSLAATAKDEGELESVTHALHALAQWDLLDREVLSASARLALPDNPSVRKYLTYLRARAGRSGRDGHHAREGRPG